MEKDSVMEINPCSLTTLGRDQDRSISVTEHHHHDNINVEDDDEGSSQVVKRPRLPSWMCWSDSSSSSVDDEEDTCKTSGKRKLEKYDEEPSQEKKRPRLPFWMCLSDSSSSVVDSARVRSNSSKSCTSSSSSSSSGGSDNVRGKRKATDSGGKLQDVKRRSIDLEPFMQDLPALVQKALFKEKYQEKQRLGEGGCGCVFAGYRKADHLPVAIKHIPPENILWIKSDHNRKNLPAEVAIMQHLTCGTNGSAGTSIPITLLDWYNVGEELILVQERPVPCMDLFTYLRELHNGYLEEDKAQIILKQLVDGAIELEAKKIFHQDIKTENILIETRSCGPRARLIDFSLSCFVHDELIHREFNGTIDIAPPEFIRQQFYEAGPTTVWQLGVVLYELVHHDVSFTTDLFLDHCLPISTELSAECQDFLRRCLEEDPEERVTLQELLQHPWLQEDADSSNEL